LKYYPPFAGFVIALTERGYTPSEIIDFWGLRRSRSSVHKILREYNRKANSFPLTKICTKYSCVGNMGGHGSRRRYFKQFNYCPFCSRPLSTSKAYRVKTDAHGDLIGRAKTNDYNI